MSDLRHLLPSSHDLIMRPPKSMPQGQERNRIPTGDAFRWVRPTAWIPGIRGDGRSVLLFRSWASYDDDGFEGSGPTQSGHPLGGTMSTIGKYGTDSPRTEAPKASGRSRPRRTSSLRSPSRHPCPTPHPTTRSHTVDDSAEPMPRRKRTSGWDLEAHTH